MSYQGCTNLRTIAVSYEESLSIDNDVRDLAHNPPNVSVLFIEGATFATLQKCVSA